MPEKPPKPPAQRPKDDLRVNYSALVPGATFPKGSSIPTRLESFKHGTKDTEFHMTLGVHGLRNNTHTCLARIKVTSVSKNVESLKRHRDWLQECMKRNDPFRLYLDAPDMKVTSAHTDHSCGRKDIEIHFPRGSYVIISCSIKKTLKKIDFYDPGVSDWFHTQSTPEDDPKSPVKGGIETVPGSNKQIKQNAQAGPSRKRKEPEQPVAKTTNLIPTGRSGPAGDAGTGERGVKKTKTTGPSVAPTAINRKETRTPSTNLEVFVEIPTHPLSASVAKGPVLTAQMERRLKLQKKAERRASRALEAAGQGGTKVLTEDERKKAQEKAKQGVEEIYKRGLQKAVGLEIQHNYLGMEKKLCYRPLSRWVERDTEIVNKRGERGDVIAVVRSIKYTPKSTPASDHRYNIQLQDPSVDPRDDFFILTIFSAERLSFGSDLRAGSVILVRDFFVTPAPDGRRRLGGRTQGRGGWQWACLALNSDDTYTEHYGTGRQAIKLPIISPQEKQAMMRLKDWWIYIARPEIGGNTDGDNGPVEIRAVGGDKRIKMSEMTAGVFCDLVVEVVATQEDRHIQGKFELYVTDYTRNEEFVDEPRIKEINEENEDIRPEMVTEITLWDSNASEAVLQSIQPGEWLYLRNVKVAMRNGNLQGALHEQINLKNNEKVSHGIGWRRLNVTDPLVVELLSRKEDVLKEPIPSTEPQKSSGSSDWDTSVNTQIRTIHSSQPVSSIREVLQNTTVPNRFRIKARVETIPGIGKPSKIMVKWCIPCERSFSGDYCYMCKDQAAADAEYRYRFWAMFQDEKDGPTLPVQFDHRLVNKFLHKLPSLQEGETAYITKSVQAAARIKVLLWDAKINGEWPRHVGDWSIESYWTQHPAAPEKHVKQFRVFDMMTN